MIYVVPDTQGSIKKIEQFAKKIESTICRELTQRDYLILNGRLITQNNGTIDSLIQYLETCQWTTLITANEHNDHIENVLHATKTKRFANTCLRLGTDVLYLEDGKIYDIPIDEYQSRKILILGQGCRTIYRWSTNKNTIIEPNKTNNKYGKLKGSCVDYIIAGDAPYSQKGKLSLLVKDNETSRMFDELKNEINYRTWIFSDHLFDYRPSKGYICAHKKPYRIK